MCWISLKKWTAYLFVFSWSYITSPKYRITSLASQQAISGKVPPWCKCVHFGYNSVTRDTGKTFCKDRRPTEFLTFRWCWSPMETSQIFINYLLPWDLWSDSFSHMPSFRYSIFSNTTQVTATPLSPYVIRNVDIAWIQFLVNGQHCNSKSFISQRKTSSINTQTKKQPQKQLRVNVIHTAIAKTESNNSREKIQEEIWLKCRLEDHYRQGRLRFIHNSFQWSRFKRSSSQDI